MIVEITNDVFRNTQAMSFSRLSKLADGPQSYKASLEEKEFSLGLAFGSIVDILLTSPENLEKEFYIMSSDKPSSDMMLRFCEVYAETGNEQEAHAASGFKIGLNAVLSKFNTEGKAYYDSLILGKGKKIIDTATYFAANQTVNTLKSNPYTKRYFDETQEDVEILYQVPLIWESEIDKLPEGSEVVKFKGLVDLIRIDHNLKQVEVIDIKTGAESFWKSYWKYKYYLQGSMYYTGVSKWLSETEIKDYKIIPTKFIFADSNLYYPPLIFSMTENDIVCGMLGYRPVLHNERGTPEVKTKGYNRLAAELNWHIRNDAWDYPYDVYQNNGEVKIDGFNPKI